MMNGKGLRTWRERMNWSQEQAASAFQVGRRAYQELEDTTQPLDFTVEAYAMTLEAGRNLNLEKDFADGILRLARARVLIIDDMPKRGRPRGDARQEALEKLYEAADKHMATLNHLRGLLQHQKSTFKELTEIIEAVLTVRKIS